MNTFEANTVRVDAMSGGLYDCAIVAVITTYQALNAADLVVCKSTLEHVRNTGAALTTPARLLNEGDTLLVFVPSRCRLCTTPGAAAAASESRVIGDAACPGGGIYYLPGHLLAVASNRIGDSSHVRRIREPCAA
jgi:hypothetical protein